MNKKKIIKVSLKIIIGLFGIFLFIFGGYDDSPGAQGLGLLIFSLAIFLGFRKRNKKGE